MAAASSIFAFLDDDDWLAAMKVACSSSDIGSMFGRDVSTLFFYVQWRVVVVWLFIIAEM